MNCIPFNSFNNQKLDVNFEEINSKKNSSAGIINTKKVARMKLGVLNKFKLKKSDFHYGKANLKN